jgi:hypothetical protein
MILYSKKKYIIKKIKGLRIILKKNTNKTRFIKWFLIFKWRFPELDIKRKRFTNLKIYKDN